MLGHTIAAYDVAFCGPAAGGECARALGVKHCLQTSHCTVISEHTICFAHLARRGRVHGKASLQAHEVIIVGREADLVVDIHSQLAVKELHVLDVASANKTNPG